MLLGLHQLETSSQVPLPQRLLLDCEEALGEHVAEAPHLALAGQVESLRQGSQLLDALWRHVLRPALLLQDALEILRPLGGTLWVLRPPTRAHLLRHLADRRIVQSSGRFLVNSHEPASAVARGG